MQKPYRMRATEAGLTSYNYTDVAEGTGVIIFYGFDTQNDVTKSYMLSTSALYSEDRDTSGTTTNASFEKVLDINFDLTLNLPKNVRGKILGNITNFNTGAGASNAGESYAVIRFRKWDGTTQTEIGNTQTKTLVGSSSNVVYSSTDAFMINLGTNYHFKRNETIRITVEIWGKKTGSNPFKCGFAHDPQDRTNTGDVNSTEINKFIIHLPFRLDL